MSELTSAIIASDKNCFASSKIEVILFDVPKKEISSVFMNGFLGFSERFCPKIIEDIIMANIILLFIIKL